MRNEGIASIHRTRLRAGKVVAVCGCLLLLYVCSIGPVVRITGQRSKSGRLELPIWVEVVYYPLLNCPPCFLTDVVDRYVQLWL
jgi:hypothetical protein